MEDALAAVMRIQAYTSRNRSDCHHGGALVADPLYCYGGPVTRPSSREKNRTRPRPEILVPLARGHGTLRSQIEAALRDGARSGRLSPHSVLPSSRVMARDLGVSRGVVVGAYEQLIAEGFLISRLRG